MDPRDAFARALLLSGPTGAGKTALALDLAERLDAEIVCADSMTLYRGFDIGTAKPTPAERARVRHHLLDCLDPHESANVAWWLNRAGECCREIEGRGKRVLVVGGTPFYLKAILSGLFDGPPVDPLVRARLEARALTEPAELATELARVDPPSAARLHPNDVRRVVRALEVFHSTGRPLSEWQTTWADPPRLLPLVVIDREKSELAERLDRRLHQMLADGWPAEVERLLSVPWGREVSQAVGYRELAAVARGEAELAQAVERIRVGTRQLAKRQRTFLRGLPGAAWVTITPGDAPAEAVRRVLTAWGV